jgi:nucleoside-triphosphatase THEP1
MSRIVLLTGGRRLGKSTVCRKTVELAQQRGYTCGGILTLAHQGVRDVVDVHSGRRRRLTTTDAGPSVSQGRFRFDPETLSWGNEVLVEAVPCELLVVDELGPLEVERGKGWVAALDVLRTGDYVLALLVVRPELIGQVQGRLPACSLRPLSVTPENRDRLPISLVEMLERET